MGLAKVASRDDFNFRVLIPGANLSHVECRRMVKIICDLPAQIQGVTASWRSLCKFLPVYEWPYVIGVGKSLFLLTYVYGPATVCKGTVEAVQVRAT